MARRRSYSPGYHSPVVMTQTDSFGECNIIELLQADHKPTFVIDCRNTQSNGSLSQNFVFANSAMDSIGHILDRASTNDPSCREDVKFRNWVRGTAEPRGTLAGHHAIWHGGVQWSSFVFMERWKVVCALKTTALDSKTFSTHVITSKSDLSSRYTHELHDPSAEWHPQLPGLHKYEHLQSLKTYDWQASGIEQSGVLHPQFLTMLDITLKDNTAACVLWSKDLLMFYNKAYLPIAGQRHPTLLGTSLRTGFSEAWADLKSIFNTVLEAKEAVSYAELLLLLESEENSDTLTERYFSLSYVPIVDPDGTCLGVYAHLNEVTSQVLSRRRMEVLLALNQESSGVGGLRVLWPKLHDILSSFPNEVPLGVFYSLEASTKDDTSTKQGPYRPRSLAKLQWSYGIQADAVEDEISMLDQDLPLVSIFMSASRGGKPVVYRRTDKSGNNFPPWLSKMMLSTSKEKMPYNTVFVFALRTSFDGDIRGYLVLGWHPLQSFGPELMSFISLLEAHMNSAVSSAVLFEETVQRSQDAASAALKEARTFENQFQRVAVLAPIGIAILNSANTLLYANNKWRELCGYPETGVQRLTWQWVVDEDAEINKKFLRMLIAERKSVTCEMRLKTPWYGPNKEKPFSVGTPTWVLCSGYTETSDLGEVESVTCCIVDISQQKWAEEESQRRTRDISEFIDRTSHEIRNPLGVIMQCADSIIDNLSSFTDNETCQKMSTSIDQANTILHCTDYQKRIVDDILTLSKIESGLITFVYRETNIVHMIEETLGMLKHLARSADVSLKVELHPTLTDNRLMELDSARVTQILINLVTNAIKFTQTESVRSIVIKARVFFDLASNPVSPPLKFCERRERPERKSEKMKKPIWLLFEVQDSGRGISTQDQGMLFERFKQIAGTRTHVSYGGSGLGLFISRKLAELQGGLIGVYSPGEAKGSNFAFYVVAELLSQESNEEKTAIMDFPSPAISSSEPIPPLNSDLTDVTRSVSQDVRLDKLSVLLVEDNLVNQKVLSVQLRRLGYVVHVANNGQQALDFLRTTNLWCQGDKREGESGESLDLSLILLDVEMPVMDGLTCIRRIRELETMDLFIRHVPVIAITANARPEQIATAMKAGMDAVVSKPFRVPELVSKIASILLIESPGTGRAQTPDAARLMVDGCADGFLIE